MTNHLVGIGEIKVSDGIYKDLRVVALGSCVAVIFYAWKLKKVAVAHVALPESSHGQNGNKGPGYFADIAITKLVAMFKKLGIKNKREITIKLVGGASIMDPKGTFDIGKRNILAVRKNLWLYSLGATSEDVGENYSRSMTVSSETGDVLISSPAKGKWIL